MKSTAIDELHADATGGVAVVHGSGLKVDITDKGQVPGRKHHGGASVQAQVVAREQHFVGTRIHRQHVIVRCPIGLGELGDRGGNRTAKSTLVSLARIAVMSAVVQHHEPAFGADGGWDLPVEFEGPQCRFGAGGLRHDGTVGLTEFVGLDAVFIKEEQVDGVVNHDDAHLVHVARLQDTKVNDDADIGVDGDGRRKAGAVLREAGRGCSSLVGLNTHGGSEQKQHERPCRQPTHGGSILLVHFNDWVGCSSAPTPRVARPSGSSPRRRQPPNGRYRSAPPRPHLQRLLQPHLRTPRRL